MISNYIKCPKLLSECQLLAESDVEEYIGYLEIQRYSDKTITSYISSQIVISMLPYHFPVFNHIAEKHCK